MALDRKDWKERLDKAKTDKEISALIMEVPDATGPDIRTEARKCFIMEQEMISQHLTSTTRTAKTEAG